MKTQRKMTSCLAILAAMGMTTMATAEEPKTAEKPQNVHIPATQIVGAEIRNANDESITTVDDVVIDRNGQVHYLIAGVGGLAGLGQSQVAIPLKAINCECEMNEENEQECYMTISMTQEKLSQAPKLKKENLGDLQDANWVSRNQAHFSIDSEQRDSRKARNLTAFSQINDAAVQAKAGEGESVGQLDDLVFNPMEGKMEFAVIGLGGTLSLGEHYVATRFDALQFSKNEEEGRYTVSSRLTEEQLKKAPKVTSPDYLELENEEFRELVRDMK